MTKIPSDVPRWIVNPRDMGCVYGEYCNRDCGHKKIHKENTACHNQCVVYGEITCGELIFTWREKLRKFWEKIGQFGDRIITKLETFL